MSNPYFADKHDELLLSLWGENAPSKTQLRIGHRVVKRAQRRLDEQGEPAPYDLLYELYADMVEDGDFNGVRSENTRTRLLANTWVKEEAGGDQ